MAIDSEKVAANAAAMMMRHCAVAAATPRTTPSTLTSPSWPPRMTSRSARPIPRCSSSGSCSGPGCRRPPGSGCAIRAILPSWIELAGPRGLGLAAGAAAVHHQVGVAHHEGVLVGDVVQHGDHVVALDVQRRAALVANQVVMVGALFGELVVGAVPDAGLLDKTELLEDLQATVDRRQVEARILSPDLAQDVLGAEVFLAVPQGIPDQLALHCQPVAGRMERLGRRRARFHRLIVAGASISTIGRSPAVAALSSSRKKMIQMAAQEIRLPRPHMTS